MAKRKRNSPKKDLVFEIGIEELPVSYFDCLYQKQATVTALFANNGLAADKIELYITPRRAIFHVQNLPTERTLKEEIIKGPTFDKCYDKDGKPTAVLKGFLKSKQARLNDIFELHDQKRHCVAIKRTVGGQPTEEVLRQILPQVLAIFSFPRMMTWNESKVRFPRPVRWLLCLYGNTEITFSMAGITARRITYGHRYVAPGPVRIADTNAYFRVLTKKNVIIDERKRMSIIERELRKEARRSKLDFSYFDKELITIIARLTENPYLLKGTFKKEYMNLPADVLATCMKKNQKIFACYSPRGSLTNTFIAFLDGRRKDLAGIRIGYENVLESRLRDAAFFIKEDAKEPMAKKVDKLHKIVFLGTLGTYYDKMQRLVALSEHLGKQAIVRKGNISLNNKHIGYLKDAARLCKVDLVTHIVYEFPELQGIAGREYLKREKYPPEVYLPVSEHYVPKSLSDDVRFKAGTEGLLGALLGIADRIDMVVGALGLGIEVSGSEDPYALRRASGCVVRIIRHFLIQCSLADMVRKSYAAYNSGLTVGYEALFNKLKDIFKERIVFAARVTPGSLDRMILDSVLATSFDDINDAFERFEILRRMATHRAHQATFKKACKVVERTANILKGYKRELIGTIATDLFQEQLEHDLYAACNAHKDRIATAIKNREYEAATRAYAQSFFDIVHTFFDKVLVNVDDESIQKNRLLLMKRINELYTKEVADLSLIQGLE